jgi:hypothetical protein
MSHCILLFCDGPKSYSIAMENDRGHVRHCEIWEKNAQKNDTLNIARSEILRQAATRARTHTHTHPRGLFYANACNEVIYFSAALWQCYGFKSSGMWCIKGTHWFNLQEWLFSPPLKHLEPLTRQSITFQNIWILINTAGRTWNLTRWCYSVSHVSSSTVSTSPCTSQQTHSFSVLKTVFHQDCIHHKEHTT